eukprot:1158744-Pelagomonas_calceolata.AAC.15
MNGQKPEMKARRITQESLLFEVPLLTILRGVLIWVSSVRNAFLMFCVRSVAACVALQAA